jgi:hypothetical protein
VLRDFAENIWVKRLVMCFFLPFDLSWTGIEVPGRVKWQYRFDYSHLCPLVDNGTLAAAMTLVAKKDSTVYINAVGFRVVEFKATGTGFTFPNCFDEQADKCKNLDDAGG